MGDKDDLAPQQESSKNFEQRLDTIRKREIVDAKFGFVSYTEISPRNAWLVNFQPSEIYDEMSKTILAATDFYFLDENAERFKISYPFRPYLYVASTKGTEFAVASYLSARFTSVEVERVEKEDLDLKNHLSRLKSVFLKVSFPSVAELSSFKKEMNPLVKKNKEIIENTSEYAIMLAEHLGAGSKAREKDISEQIIDMREHDLPYHMRVCIDNKIFAGLWYTVVGRNALTRLPLIKRNEDIVEPPIPSYVCAFDIETTKLPLKFPDSDFDQIMMISYMIDGVGFLIINREIVSEDVEDFEYTPRPEFKGEFTVFNEPDEKAVVQKFFDHLLRVQPSVMVTYNGDFFDWPFVEARAAVHGIFMNDYIGFHKDSQDEYKHNNCIHMDAFRWVVRDSYLPMGSQNLKATTKAKLRYDPVELDPELMLEMARHQPMTLASYSVSDAVATYYLYMKYVHPFIFALCTIIPLGPDDVLRKGSGTLCEALLMVEAFHKNIIFPNKKIMRDHQLTADGHLMNSETYVGGHVEALESGVFRADVSCKFRLDPEALMELREKVRTTMSTSLEIEMKINLDDVENLNEVCAEAQRQLDLLIEQPIRNENPKIYHLDVGAMYPNIILTNRLQPPAVVTEEDCLACVYNHPEAKCKRHMNWVWRGEVIPASKGEYERLMQQLEQEKFGKPPKPFHLLPHEERSKIEKKRIQDFCRTAYGKLHLTRIETRTTTICQRENAFYVDTVLAFRDRRYEYKAMLKKAKNAAAAVACDDLTGQKMAQARVVLFESLQLAHKCILNSFYGYAMRKGSRWFSMEMAGIVCHTGANIIKEARELVERIGRPLELDTDGIWCLLPHTFPENFVFKLKSGKSITVSYPGAMLNELVKDKFTNDQYHTLMPDDSYKVSSENSIFFEVDGPYLAMILPASKEEGKKLKKRYAVFNFDGSLAELKGFEVKRRGELAIIKHFQTSVFKAFLKGTTLQEIYENVAKEADYWMDILFTKGEDLPNEELFDLIGENRSMSKKLEEYGSQKSTSITTAKRLAEFLGDDMVKNAGLACKFIISKYPQGAPVTERTIPLAIFQAEPSICCHYLRKWTKNSAITLNNINVRDLIDWSYYIERMGSCIQKIITIPAALQGISNPVPRVPHPNWLENKRRERIEMHTQPKITDMLKRTKPEDISINSTPHQSNKSALTDSTAKTRKRFLPQEGYDESASNTNIFGRENDETSVSMFSGLIKDQHVLVSKKLHKRQKPDNYYDNYDDSNAMGFPDTNDGGADADGEELIHLDELTNDCDGSEHPTSSVSVAITSNSIEFWKRPVKGKKFAAKRKNRSGPATFSALLSGKTTTDLSTLERKTWSKDGFHVWHKYLKTKWDAQLALRRREQIKQLTNPTMTPRTMKRNLPRRWAGTNGGSMLHIIQICETKIPGQYTVYAVGEDGMRHFNLTVPRVFYVDDTKTRKESDSCRLVQKVLPKMRPCSNLYEYTVDESQFSTHLNDFNMELCSMRISGIYETQTPLLFKAIVQLGGACLMETVRNSLDVSIEHLHKIGKTETSYIGMDALRIMFFYEFTYLNRSVFALFAPSLEEGRIYIVNRSHVSVGNVEKLYKDEYKKFTDQRGPEILDERCRQLAIHVVQTTSLRDASRELAVCLKAFKLSPSDPLVFCIQSVRSGSSLVREFPFLGGHPHIRLNITESPSIMGVLDWPNMMAKRSIQHFFNSFIYLKDYFYMANYIEMPVGNIVPDMPILALDIMYARQLRLRNYLLWSSPSAKPDFGRKDLEDYRLNNTWETASFHQNTASIYNREAFVSQDVVVELALGAVAVTALIQSSRIAEAEGTSESISFTAGNATSLSIESAMLNRLALTNYDEGISASGALKILKELFHHIVRDIHLEENIFADQMVVNMHRWIRNPSSLLYHPAVSEAVSTMMRKLCLLLVTEVNRLGGRVIHCSFTKIVLSTNRSEPRLARGFVESLLESLAHKPTFASLHLSVLQYSRLFVWINPTNYGLVKCHNMDTDVGVEGSELAVTENDQQRRKQVRLHFLMSNCLPEEGDCLKMFKSLIAGYLVKMAETLDEENMTEEKFDAFCNQLLMEEVTPTLFSLTTKFVEIRHQLKTHDKNLPVYLTSLDEFDVPLEFVKCVCKILSTNPYITLNLESVRSQLMRILQVDDAAPSTFWMPPPVNLALEYVFCQSCTQSTSLDVTTDVAETPEGGLAFICPLCHSVLSSTMVEELLVDRVSRMVLAYTLQDYQCVRCKKISALQMDCRCECRNSFENTIPAGDFRLNLMAVREVAKRHSLIDLDAHIAQIFRTYDETDSSNATTSKTIQNL